MERQTGRISGILSRLGEGRWRRFVIIGGLAAIVLLFLSTLTPKSGSTAQPEERYSEEATRLEQELEKRLTELISSIDGVSSPRVMVTLESTQEKVFAEEAKTNTSSGGTSTENAPALAGSAKEAIEKSVIMPKVRGVAVVCGGAENALIKEKVVNTAARVLNIGVSQVYVTN